MDMESPDYTPDPASDLQYEYTAKLTCGAKRQQSAACWLCQFAATKKGNQMQELSNFIDEVTGSNVKNLRGDRPYNGQRHTDTGERGKQIVSGVTMRDLRDCLLRSFFLCSGHISHERYEEANKGEDAQLCDNDLYGWNLDDIDPVALMQNFTCEVERIMGIFPNVPKLETLEIPVIDLKTGETSTEILQA